MRLRAKVPKLSQCRSFYTRVCLVFVGVASAPARAWANDLPVYLVQHATEPVTADGLLTEGFWTEAAWSEEFAWLDAGDPAPLRSRFKTVYNNEGLHFAFEFDSTPATPIPLDPDMPQACEVFLDPEGSGRRYLEYAVTPGGEVHAMVWHGHASIRDWKVTLGFPARVGLQRIQLSPDRERVIYEISLPWSALSSLAPHLRVPPSKGDAWRANFSRVETGEFAGDYSWSPAGFYYMHHPNSFGWLVFSGDKDPPQTISAASLKPLPQEVETFRPGPQFRLFNRTWWARFPVLPAEGGDLWVVTKCSVTRVGSAGHDRFHLTRKNGLPQFLRAIATVREGLYVAGEGIGKGLAFVDGDGRTRRPTKADGYELDGMPLLCSLGSDRCLVAVEDQFQIVEGSEFLPPVTSSGKIQSAAPMPGGGFVVGTTIGFECYDAGRALQESVAVAGGIVSAKQIDEVVVGVSGKNGLYLMYGEGENHFYPSPLRTKFESVFTDASGRCWASYLGGLALIERGTVRWFNEPCGIPGFRINGAAPTRDGKMVFAGTVPNGTWYQTGRYSSFLLVYDGKRWESLTFAEGLPGSVNSIANVEGTVYLSTNAGVYLLRI